MKSKATTKIVLDNRRKKNNDVYPVKLRVTFQREQKYFPTGYDMTQEEFEKVLNGNARGELKETRMVFRLVYPAPPERSKVYSTHWFATVMSRIFSIPGPPGPSNLRRALQGAVGDQIFILNWLNSLMSKVEGKVCNAKLKSTAGLLV